MTKYLHIHDVAFRKARDIAEAARPPMNDREFWNNDYTDDMIAIIRDPSFMSGPAVTYFGFALTDEDRDFCEQYILRSREVDIADRKASENTLNQLIAAEAMGLTPAEARELM